MSLDVVIIQGVFFIYAYDVILFPKANIAAFCCW